MVKSSEAEKTGSSEGQEAAPSAQASPARDKQKPSRVLRLIAVMLLGGILIIGYRLVSLAVGSDDRSARTEVERRLFKARNEIEQNPRAAGPHVKLAITQAEMGDYEVANEQLARAKKLEPTFFRAYYLAALNYEKMGDLASAEKELLTAAKIVRQNVTGGSWEPIYFRLGQIYVKTKKWDKAIEQLNAALALRSTGADTLVVLGLAYEGKGQADEAKERYERALEFDNANQEAKAALARLNK